MEEKSFLDAFLLDQEELYTEAIKAVAVRAKSPNKELKES